MYKKHVLVIRQKICTMTVFKLMHNVRKESLSSWLHMNKKSQISLYKTLVQLLEYARFKD